jgi:hypothetical protein
METFKTNTWKSKIDPAFDKIIKTYVDFLTPFGKSPREGRLNFPADFIEPVLEKSGLQNAYNQDLESLEVMLVFLEKIGILSKKDINIFHAFLSSENVDDMIKICPEMIKTLPEDESRQYYIKKLDVFNKHPELKPTSQVVDKNTVDFYSIVISLFVRYFFAKSFEDKKETVNEEEEIKYFKKSDVMIPFLGVVLSSISQLAHQRTLVELKGNIIKGDDKSLFKAITIDKTLLYVEEVKNRITQAQLSGDSDFFNKLGKAIASNPLKRIGQHGKTYAVLNLFWLMGLYKLTNEELYEFLKSCGLIPPDYPYAFQKFVRRHIRPVYNF